MKLRGGWGQEVTAEMVRDHDHTPERIRLMDFRGREIPTAYYACSTCEQPFFFSTDGVLIQPTSAEPCGCIPDAEPCLVHMSENHPVNA